MVKQRTKGHDITLRVPGEHKLPENAEKMGGIYHIFVLLLLLCVTVEVTSSSHRSIAIVASSRNGDYNDEDDDNAPRKSKGIQIMITQRMRRVLEDELGYGTDEVDVMEPQIAAVVIERGLARPAAGMPKSWRKKKTWSPVVDRKLIENVKNRIKSLGEQLKAPASFAVKKILPVAVIGGATYLALPYLAEMLGMGKSLLIGGLNAGKKLRLPSWKLPSMRLPKLRTQKRIITPKAVHQEKITSQVQEKNIEKKTPKKKTPPRKLMNEEVRLTDTGRVDMKALHSVLNKSWFGR